MNTVYTPPRAFENCCRNVLKVSSLAKLDSVASTILQVVANHLATVAENPHGFDSSDRVVLVSNYPSHIWSFGMSPCFVGDVHLIFIPEIANFREQPYKHCSSDGSDAKAGISTIILLLRVAAALPLCKSSKVNNTSKRNKLCV